MTRRAGEWISVFAISFLLAPFARAQLGLITFDRPFHARNLAGVVVDSTGAAVPGVVVEECDALFTPLQPRSPTGEAVPGVPEVDCDREPKHVLASATTDANGRFAFQRAKMGTTHYLYLRGYGLDPMKLTVMVRRFARANLRIRIRVAT